MVYELKGHVMDHGWMPHKPETWAYRFADLRKPVENPAWEEVSDGRN